MKTTLNVGRKGWWATVALFLAPVVAFGQTTQNVTQIANLRLSNSGNAGIWGWVGSDGTEYALPTTRSGVAVVSLKDPRNPQELFHLASAPGTWQEVVTVGTFLYKVADQGESGLQVFDLSPLPNRPIEHPAIKDISRAHMVWADTQVTPRRLYLNSGRVRVYSLADPAKPSFMGTLNQSAHDGMARANRVYLSARGGVDVWDVANVSSPVRAGRIEFSVASQILGEGSPGYSHNVWVTNDNKYAFTTEETNGKTVKMWDISDIKNPKFTGGNFITGTSMAHNVYVRNNVVYLSDYGDGVRILDYRDPTKLVELGFHDPGGSSWGCYPWLPSGLILHGNGGLRVFDPSPQIRQLGSSTPVRPGNGIHPFAITAMDRHGLRFNLPRDGVYGISLHDPAGRQVLQTLKTGLAGPQTMEWRGLAKGNYFLTLIQGDRLMNARVAIGN